MKLAHLFSILLLTCSSVVGQGEFKLKGLVINPVTFKKKEFPKVTIGIEGVTKTENSNEKGEFEIKTKGTVLIMTSDKYIDLKKEIPVSAKKVLILVNEYRALIKFLGEEGKFEDFYKQTKKEFEKLPLMIDKPPVFPGCEGVSVENKIKCFSKKSSAYVIKYFNAGLAQELNLSLGKHRIWITYEINKEGEVGNIRVRAPHPRLGKEGLRIIKKLPKIKPGIHKGKKVNVKFALPIGFVVE